MAGRPCELPVVRQVRIAGQMASGVGGAILGYHLGARADRKTVVLRILPKTVQAPPCHTGAR